MRKRRVDCVFTLIRERVQLFGCGETIAVAVGLHVVETQCFSHALLVKTDDALTLDDEDRHHHLARQILQRRAPARIFRDVAFFVINRVL